MQNMRSSRSSAKASLLLCFDRVSKLLEMLGLVEADASVQHGEASVTLLRWICDRLLDQFGVFVQESNDEFFVLGRFLKRFLGLGEFVPHVCHLDFSAAFAPLQQVVLAFLRFLLVFLGQTLAIFEDALLGFDQSLSECVADHLATLES